MNESKAIFLSYASEDREAANRIAEVLRDAGVEVWFDQSELRGGDAWDAKIRGQIRTCALFLVLISKNTRARHEGYFRLEWKLAIDRSHLMSQARPFLMPVSIDDSTEEHDGLPDRFREVQWSHLSRESALPAFVGRVIQLLDQLTTASGTIPSLSSLKPSPGRKSVRRISRPSIGPVVFFIAAIALAAYLYLPRLRQPAQPGDKVAINVNLKPAQHSIAVMPLANLSGDTSQDYFSEGLSEELRTSLARLQGLQVASRSASSSVAAKSETPSEIGHKLHVAALLEGSIRREGTKIRISVQLVDATSGFEVWSQSYDRELQDILAMQAEIATAVAQGLRLKLIDRIADVIKAGGTTNPKALDVYLRAIQAGLKFDQTAQEDALSLSSQAISLDPSYASAYAYRGQAEYILAGLYDPTERIAGRMAESLGDLERAVQLAPQVASFHSQMGSVLAEGVLDLPRAQREHELAAQLAPDDAIELGSQARFQGLMGHRSAVSRLTQRIIQLNSPDALAYYNGAAGLLAAGLYEDAFKFVARATDLGLEADTALALRCVAWAKLHRDAEVISSCSRSDQSLVQVMVTISLFRTNRAKEAEVLLQKIEKENGDAAAYQYALIESQRGDTAAALKWLEKAYELKDAGLLDMKTDSLLDPIRNEGRFQVVQQKLNFPP